MTQTNKEREEYENFEAWLCTLNSFSPSELRFGFLAWQAAKQSPISQNEQQEAVGIVTGLSIANNPREFEWYKPVELGAKLYLSPPKQAIPEGWKLVPIEPTQDMLFASLNHHKEGGNYAVYKAMLNAAPTNTEV